MNKPLVAGAAVVAVAAGAAYLISRRRRGGPPSPPTAGLDRPNARAARAGRDGLAPFFETRGAGGQVVKGYRKEGMTIKERLELMQGMVAADVRDPEMRRTSLQVTNGCPERDDLCELKAIYADTKRRVRYSGDVGAHMLWPGGPVDSVDFYSTGKRTLEAGAGDCLPAGTLLLAEGHKLTPIEQVVIGSRIWGLDGWTTVRDAWAKGVLPVDVVFLSNGSSFKATPDHKIYVALCKSHPIRWKWENGKSCSCGMENRSVERIHVSQLEEKMVVVQPERINFGDEEMDPRRAYVEGLYLADGFKGHATDFAISADDGYHKEGQKSEVEAICESLGIPTTWQRKYITVRDRAWALRMQQMGTKAWNKRALSISLKREAAAELLRGICADASVRDNVLTTTSRELFLQARMLYRMMGVTCGESYIVDHGGAGEHPIWRLTPRTTNRFVRVRSIERAALSLPVYDISTEDHYVYLPEADVTVSNCDDQSVLNASRAVLNGFTAKFRATSPYRWGRDNYTHVYTLVGLPKNDPKKWVAVDTTLPGDNHLGEEYPFAKHFDVIA